jgi:uncharacterized membrane protein YdjX (TVP38/TMEM64 family)
MADSSPKKINNILRLILPAGLLVTAIILLRFTAAGDKLADLREWISSLGSWGPLVFVLIYILAVVAALPGSAITIAGAALFGSVGGVILVSIASTIGAGLAFLIARYLARNFITGKLAHNDHFQKLESLTAEHGAIIVAIVRLVPLFPFNIVNYGFGLTAISFRTYVVWSWLCMLPGTILYVVGTDAVVSGLASGKISWLLIGICLLVGIILILLVRQAKKKIDKKTAAADKNQ